jgi:hypothetical protein
VRGAGIARQAGELDRHRPLLTDDFLHSPHFLVKSCKLPHAQSHEYGGREHGEGAEDDGTS